MAVIFAKQALLGGGWASNVRVEVDAGVISAIYPETKPGAADVHVDTLLPALANVHSHSFQRFMAGMTEYRAATKDSFWTWRDLMYRFAARLTPDQIEAAAALTFMEMLEAGFAAVGEFHYLHHQNNGLPYDNVAELSCRIFAAAEECGIGLAHLPVLYTYGGAGKSSLSQGQMRFGNSIDAFLTLVEATDKQMRSLPADCTMGVAPHSLRATSPEDLELLLTSHGGGTIHIHIAEQTKEVDDIKQWLGAAPVEWLLNNTHVGANWCLIHATHMTEQETVELAKSGAVAGLCPITEANLGDGIFNGKDYLTAGGAFAIGSDSNIQISLGGELRLLEYSQRLQGRARNIMVTGEGSVGRALYTSAAMGGAKALGRSSGSIKTGNLADLVAIDSDIPALCALNANQLLDGLVFAAKDDCVTDVWSAGRHVVKNGEHIKRQAIIAKYKTALRSLLADV